VPVKNLLRAATPIVAVFTLAGCGAAATPAVAHSGIGSALTTALVVVPADTTTAAPSATPAVEATPSPEPTAVPTATPEPTPASSPELGYDAPAGIAPTVTRPSGYHVYIYTPPHLGTPMFYCSPLTTPEGGAEYHGGGYTIGQVDGAA
jgi:hypothetical protein